MTNYCGWTRTSSEPRYFRFFQLTGPDLAKAEQIALSLGLTTGSLYAITEIGNKVAHKDRTPTTVPDLRSLLENPNDDEQMKRKKEKFIEALYHYKMVDDKQQVQTFLSIAGQVNEMKKGLRSSRWLQMTGCSKC